jgi:hypothetical protein
MFKRSYSPLFLFLILTLTSVGFGQTKSSGDGLWREIDDSAASMRSAERQIIPAKYKTFRLDKTLLRTFLDSAPEELSDPYGMSNAIITLPMPDGGFERFRIQHSLVVEPLLLKKYPELGATFRGQGIDDPTATVRIDLLPSGFHSMILSPRGTVMVDPYSNGDTANYISYYKRDVSRTTGFSCDVDTQHAIESISKPKKSSVRDFIPDFASAAPEVTSGTQLRTYRLALAATGEYTAAVGGGTVSGALAAQVLIMNRVNGVYERDLSMRMVIVGNNNVIIYTNSATDPYTNTNGTTMLSENQTNVDAVIGTANYDIGHVFSTGGGGVAGVGVPCGVNKARGVTGLSNPVGDAFAIDFVAHEIGHQWGALHTFNGGTGNCSGGNRTAASAYEPGSGITIMGYAGICGSQDLAGNSIDSFHVKSLEDIVAYSQTGNGNTCAATTATGNTPPTVSSPGGASFNIPRLTPFTLTAASTDANGDTVTYDWQEYDLGPQTSSVPNTDSDGSAKPIFRPFSPTSNPSRTFPSNQYILANANVPPNTTGGFLTGELLPSIARTMNFQVIARDNRTGGGGINTATVSVVVAGTGPFNVTAPNTNTTWFLNSNPTVTWNVGGSDGAPMNFANVRILLSTDGGATFPTVLSASTPNDGSQSVVSPAIDTSTARVRIEPIGGIFFDVSDSNFAISLATGSGTTAGRIATAGGRGLARVYVTLTGGTPSITRTAITNAFGYYQFENIPFGQYTITPAPRKGKTYTPASIVRDHQSSATDLNFTVQ